MGWLDAFRRRGTGGPVAVRAQLGGAMSQRRLRIWQPPLENINSQIASGGPRLLARSRESVVTNGYAVLLFANIPGETRAAPGSGAAPPERLRVYQKANLSENYPLWNRHKRKRPRSRVPPSSASARCSWRWNTAMSIRAKRLALTAIAGKLGCSPDSLRVWMRQVQRDGGERSGQTRAKNARITELEREVRELRQGEEGQKTIRGIVFPTNEILRKASAYFAQVRKVMRRCFSIA